MSSTDPFVNYKNDMEDFLSDSTSGDLLSKLNNCKIYYIPDGGNYYKFETKPFSYKNNSALGFTEEDLTKGTFYSNTGTYANNPFLLTIQQYATGSFQFSIEGTTIISAANYAYSFYSSEDYEPPVYKTTKLASFTALTIDTRAETVVDTNPIIAITSTANMIPTPDPGMFNPNLDTTPFNLKGYFIIVSISDALRTAFLNAYPQYKVACCMTQDNRIPPASLLCITDDGYMGPRNQTCDDFMQGYCLANVTAPECACYSVDQSVLTIEQLYADSHPGEPLPPRICTAATCQVGTAYVNTNNYTSSCNQICEQVEDVNAGQYIIVTGSGTQEMKCYIGKAPGTETPPISPPGVVDAYSIDLSLATFLSTQSLPAVLQLLTGSQVAFRDSGKFFKMATTTWSYCSGDCNRDPRTDYSLTGLEADTPQLNPQNVFTLQMSSAPAFTLLQNNTAVSFGVLVTKNETTAGSLAPTLQLAECRQQQVTVVTFGIPSFPLDDKGNVITGYGGVSLRPTSVQLKIVQLSESANRVFVTYLCKLPAPSPAELTYLYNNIPNALLTETNAFFQSALKQKSLLPALEGCTVAFSTGEQFFQHSAVEWVWTTDPMYQARLDGWTPGDQISTYTVAKVQDSTFELDQSGAAILFGLSIAEPAVTPIGGSGTIAPISTASSTLNLTAATANTDGSITMAFSPTIADKLPTSYGSVDANLSSTLSIIALGPSTTNAFLQATFPQPSPPPPPPPPAPASGLSTVAKYLYISLLIPIFLSAVLVVLGAPRYTIILCGILFAVLLALAVLVQFRVIKL